MPSGPCCRVTAQSLWEGEAHAIGHMPLGHSPEAVGGRGALLTDEVQYVEDKVVDCMRDPGPSALKKQPPSGERTLRLHPLNAAHLLKQSASLEVPGNEKRSVPGTHRLLAVVISQPAGWPQLRHGCKRRFIFATTEVLVATAGVDPVAW